MNKNLGHSASEIGRGIQFGLRGATCGDGRRFIVRSDEFLSAFLELEGVAGSRPLRIFHLRDYLCDCRCEGLVVTGTGLTLFTL